MRIVNNDIYKKCSRCKQRKERALEFSTTIVKDKKQTSAFCHDCNALRASEYRKTDKGKLSLKRQYLKKQYKMSLEEYDTIIEAQGNVCACCEIKKKLKLFMHHNKKMLVCTVCKKAFTVLLKRKDIQRAFFFLIDHSKVLI